MKSRLGRWRCHIWVMVVLLRGTALGVGTVAEMLISAGALLLAAVLSWLLAVRWLGRALTS